MIKIFNVLMRKKRSKKKLTNVVEKFMFKEGKKK